MASCTHDNDDDDDDNVVVVGVKRKQTNVVTLPMQAINDGHYVFVEGERPVLQPTMLATMVIQTLCGSVFVHGDKTRSYTTWDDPPAVWTHGDVDMLRVRLRNTLLDVALQATGQQLQRVSNDDDGGVSLMYQTMHPRLNESPEAAMAVRIMKMAKKESTVTLTFRMVCQHLKDTNDVFKNSLDADPHRLAIGNKIVIDMRTGEIFNRTHIDRFTYACDADVIFPLDTDSIDDLPWMKRFVESVWPDKALCTYAQTLLGSLLSGDRRDETISLLYGPRGRNGKTTTCRMLAMVLGPNYAGAPSDIFIKSGIAIPHLKYIKNKRLLVFYEPSLDPKTYVRDVLKFAGHLSNLRCKLLLQTTAMPRWNDSADQSARGRFRILPYSTIFYDPTNVPKNTNGVDVAMRVPADPRFIDDQLLGTRKGRSEVLTWFLRGTFRWYKQHCSVGVVPECVRHILDA